MKVYTHYQDIYRQVPDAAWLRRLNIAFSSSALLRPEGVIVQHVFLRVFIRPRTVSTTGRLQGHGDFQCFNGASDNINTCLKLLIKLVILFSFYRQAT